ncbi:MAG TPA: hypothetical protein VGP80_12230 [Gemmatimonadales bacterium]|nr:hypothetical protein [Gemmatimonadales bacterium]
MLLLLTLATTPLAAQFDTSTVAGRVLERRMAALEDDSTIKQFADLGRLDYASGLGAANLARLDDQSVLLFARLLSRGMVRTSAEDCARVMGSPTGGDEFWLIMGQSADSLEAEEWATLLTQVVWAEVEQRSPNPVATPGQVELALISVIRHSPGKQQEMIGKIAQGPDAACRLTPWMMTRLMVKTPAHAATLIRGMMGAGSSQ